MYSKADIIKKLSNEGQFIDNFILDAFIKNWHIDPIYEDDNGVEFFDDASYANIKSLMTQRDKLDKNQNTCKNNNISEKAQTIEHNEEKTQQIVETLPEKIDKNQTANKDNALKLNKYEIEIKSIDTLTKNIACKITKEFEKFLKDSDFIDNLLQSSECKNDNKYLAQKIRKLVKENVALKEKVKQLEASKTEYIKVFGNFYIKK
ncbi:MAG: hypothetical protein MRZ90_08065 [Candidatus Gastranaerophilales bacterium]|nr:hypothetical protein [Candidatus Gastranaerophilales bacterium]